MTTDLGAGAAYANENTVFLINDVQLNYTINITAAGPINLTTVDNDHTIFRSMNNVSLFKVSSGTLILQGNGGKNLTIDGNKTAYDMDGYSLIYVNGGGLNMSYGAVLQNSSAYLGGGVYLNLGTFNMSESAQVNADNDVYLDSDQSITVTGALDPSAGARNITPAFTGIGDKVVEYGSVDINNWSSNFALNPTWIQEKQMNLAQSGTNLSLSNNFTVKYYLTDSNMTSYITNTSVPYNVLLSQPADTTRTGYMFNAWNNTNSSGIPWNFTTDTVKANTNLYANWTANTYNISYSSNYGTPTITNQSVAYNSSVTLLGQELFSRSGYTLANWTTTPTGETSYAVNGTYGTYDVAGDLTLYANWTANPTPTPTSSWDEEEDETNVYSGSILLNGTFTTEDGNLTLHYPAGSNIIVTVFPNYLGGAAAPLNVSYLIVYDIYSTASAGTPVTLVFNIAASELEGMNLTPDNITILHYNDGNWYEMNIVSIELVDGEYQFTVTSTHTSPFMVAYNVDRSSFPLEEGTQTSTPTTEPTVVVPTTTSTEPTSSPVPIIGIIAGLGAAGLLLRRR